MVPIFSENNSVFLGSSNNNAPLDETPQTSSYFTYNYLIDTVEVTIGMYKSVTGSLPPEYDTMATVDNEWPVAYVSWYDAVLFCNERSKQYECDSVYDYFAVEKTATGTITRLSGLQVHYERNGFRLPTEAEWLFAARSGSIREYIWGDAAVEDSAVRNAWYSGSAVYKPQKVAQLAPNPAGLYDMAGNIAELINEDLEPLSGASVSNDVGNCSAVTRLKLGKGGSFAHDIQYLRLTGRSDLYHTDAATRNRYTGFRCVSGAITNPAFRKHTVTTTAGNPVTVLPVNTLSLFGTTHAKIVFVNLSGTRHRLCCIDYSGGSPRFIDFDDDDSVYAPIISPDGRWVAWSSRDEGSIDRSMVRIRSLDSSNTSIMILPDITAYLPRWYVDPLSRDTFIVYTSSGRMNDLIDWRQDQTRRIRFMQGNYTEEPEVICADGAYHGGISPDGSLLATGYPLLRTKNIATDLEQILFCAPKNGKPVPDTSQVCNVSIAPDGNGSGQLLFLDFGSGRTPSTLTKCTYDAHEFIFMANSSGDVLRWYQAPAPFTSWNHCEWSSHTNYAVATVCQSDGKHRAVYMLNLADSSYTPLCEGTDFYHPWLWIAPGTSIEPVSFSTDSIGQYDSPHLANSQGLLAYKMRLFWHWADSLEVVFVGSSVAADGIDPRYFTGVTALNMAVGFGDIATSLELIEQYILNHCPKIKVIGISFDINYFFIDGASIELYPTFIQSKGYQYDRRNNFWVNGKPVKFNEFINAVPLPQCSHPFSLIDSLGLIYFGCSGWGSEPPPVNGDTNVVFNEIYERNLNRFFETVARCNEKNIKVLLMTFPVQNGYQKTGAYGPMGPSRSAALRVIDYAREYSNTHPGMVFYDAGDTLMNDYSSSHFTDSGHLCGDGAARLSTRVDSILHQMID